MAIVSAEEFVQAVRQWLCSYDEHQTTLSGPKSLRAEAKNPVLIQTSMGATNTWVVTKHVSLLWKTSEQWGSLYQLLVSPDHGHHDALECIEADTLLTFDGSHLRWEEAP